MKYEHAKKTTVRLPDGSRVPFLSLSPEEQERVLRRCQEILKNGIVHNIEIAARRG